MVTILHISDLHRSIADPVSNAELIAALESDRANRWPPDLRDGPDIVVVNGDLVQGVKLGTPGYEEELDHQYRDAEQLLEELTDRFLEGTRSRMVIVPGNHDVDWNGSRLAMEPVTPEEVALLGNLQPLTLDPRSDYRWDWTDRQLYKITDRNAYDRRCFRFQELRQKFYADVSPDPLSWHPDVLFLEYPDLDLAFTGLSSWYGNDCYCHVGAIDPLLLSLAQDAISSSTCRVQIAVWHHSMGSAGVPAAHDYIDTGSVMRLIDYGYRLGLHGHHHRSDVGLLTLRLPAAEDLALISAGSLAAGKRELPRGVNRQYNVLALSPVDRVVRVYVREAIGEVVFAQSSRTDLGGREFLELSWSARVMPAKVARSTAALDAAYAAYGAGDMERAAELLSDIDADPAARRLKTEILVTLGNDQELCTLLAEPRTQEELFILVDALQRTGELAEAKSTIDQHAARLGIAQDLLGELRGRFGLLGASDE